MIRDPEAYRRLCEEDRWRELREMTIEDSIALGEALLTSEVMTLAVFPDDDHPMSLAIALGIKASSQPGLSFARSTSSGKPIYRQHEVVTHGKSAG